MTIVAISLKNICIKYETNSHERCPLLIGVI